MIAPPAHVCTHIDTWQADRPTGRSSVNRWITLRRRNKRNRRAPSTDRVAGLVTSVHTNHLIHPYASIHTCVSALSHLNRGLLRGRQRKPRSSNNYTPLTWTEAFGDDAQRKNVFRSAHCIFVLYTRHWCVRLARYDGRMRFESVAHW